MLGREGRARLSERSVSRSDVIHGYEYDQTLGSAVYGGLFCGLTQLQQAACYAGHGAS